MKEQGGSALSFSMRPGDLRSLFDIFPIGELAVIGAVRASVRGEVLDGKKQQNAN